MLNTTSTFENFIVGPENALAYSVATVVAANPGQLHNPLLILGSTGLGKTHLIHAVVHSVIRANPRARIVHVSCAEFIDEYIRVVSTPSDPTKYQEADMLIVDGIQFLSGKGGAQEELFKLFNQLHESRRQIILTSDRPPGEIKELSNRLVSRFQGGMSVEIQMPGLETRMALVECKALARGGTLTSEVIEFLAKRIAPNGHNLDGALTRIAVYSGLGGTREITVMRLEHLLRDMLVDEDGFFLMSHIGSDEL